MACAVALAGCFHGEASLLDTAAAPCPIAAPTEFSLAMIDPAGQAIEVAFARVSPDGAACVVESINPEVTGFDLSSNLIFTTAALGDDWHIVQIAYNSPDDPSVDVFLVRLFSDRVELYNPGCWDLLPGAHATLGVDLSCKLQTREQAEALMRAYIRLEREPIGVYRRADGVAA